MLKRGDIVLVPFPFTDLSKEKVRPAVVISAENDVNVSVAFISSIIPEEPTAVDFVLSESHPDFSVTGLKRSSVFKMNKVLTLERSKILRHSVEFLHLSTENLTSDLDLPLALNRPRI
jgi:mRNA interferase MazF